MNNLKKYHRIIRFVVFGTVAGFLLNGLTSCGKKDPNSPGVEFMPDMYRSPSLEYYSVHTVDGDTVYNAKHPVKGTVARGYIPFMYENSPTGYESAGVNLKNPLLENNREKLEADGEVLYTKFCIHCHGATGQGDGKVAAKLPGAPPSYSGTLKNLPEGKIFYSITYGKGLMGQHASQVNQEERWKLVAYVQKLQGPKEAPVSDSTKVTAALTSNAQTKKVN
jgi:mono/diheme cytochrome c family protein